MFTHNRLHRSPFCASERDPAPVWTARVGIATLATGNRLREEDCVGR
jgi:hypothetical protein